MKKNRLKKLHFLKIAVLRHGINKNVLLLGVFMLFGLWNFASAQTKSVTLDVKDMPLREVFKSRHKLGQILFTARSRFRKLLT